MAMLFEEDSRRLSCIACSGRRMYKRETYTYVRGANSKFAALEEYLIDTEILCCECNKVVQVVKPGELKILS